MIPTSLIACVQMNCYATLERLNLAGCKKITFEGLSIVRGFCYRLEALDISFCKKSSSADMSANNNRTAFDMLNLRTRVTVYFSGSPLQSRASRSANPQPVIKNGAITNYSTAGPISTTHPLKVLRLTDLHLTSDEVSFRG